MANKQQKENVQNKKKKDSAMNVKLIEKIVDMVKKLADLGEKVIDAGDPEKYANSVESLNRGVSDTYEQMRMIIVNSEKFSEEEKLVRLKELAEQEEESRKKCDAAIQGNREQVASIVLEVTKAFLTCGVCYVPELARNIKNPKKKAVGEIPESADTLQLVTDTADVVGQHI